MDRDLTLKFGTELKGDGDRALREIGRAATEAARPVDALFRDASERARGMAESVKAAGTAMASAYRAAGGELDKLRASMQRNQVALQSHLSGIHMEASRANVKKQSNLVDELGDRLGVPKGITQAGLALGALALTVKGLDGAMKGYYSAFERGEFSAKRLNQNLRGWVEEHVPVIGTMLEHSTTPAGATTNRVDNAVYNFAARNHSWLRPLMRFGGAGALEGLLPTQEVSMNPAEQISDAQRKYLSFRSQHEVEIARQQAAIRADTQRRQQALDLELETHRAQRESALMLRPEQFGISQRAAGARGFAIANVTGARGYGRSEELEDTLRQIGYREQQLRASAESGAHLHGLDVRRTEANRQARENMRAYKQAVEAEAPLRARLRPFDEIGKINDRLLDLQTGQRERMPGEKGALQQRLGQLRSQTGSTTVEQELRMRQQLQALEAETAARRQQANDAEKAALDLKLERENAIREAQEKQLLLSRQQYESLQAQAQALDRQKKDLTEQMGLAHPMHLRTGVGITRKIQAGKQLTQAEIGFMQGHREWFGAQVQQVAAQRAASPMMAPMIQEMMRNSGIDIRRQEIERQVMEVKHALTIDINTDQAVIDQIAKKVAAAFHDFRYEIGNQLENRMRGADNAANAQRRAMFGNVY